MSEKMPLGTIGWTDLTVDDAEGVCEFYKQVVGWNAEPVDMDGHADFNMTSPDSGQPVAGVCHRRGGNEKLPSQWLMYITVADLDASVARCKELGGEVLAGPKGEKARYCVIRDPAGAVCALWQG